MLEDIMHAANAFVSAFTHSGHSAKRKRSEEFFSKVKASGVNIDAIDDGELLDEVILCTTKYLASHSKDSTTDSVSFVCRLVEREMRTSASDEDEIVEDLLDAFYAINGYDAEKKSILASIEEHCSANGGVKFRRWMGRRLFDGNPRKLDAKCIHNGCRCQKCALVEFPGDEPGKTDLLPVCREHYGKYWYCTSDNSFWE